MVKHKKIYCDFFGYDEGDYIKCELCNNQAVDIHHICCRGMGGSKTKNDIKNLVALCRVCHSKFGDKKGWKYHLQFYHNINMLRITGTGKIKNENCK